MSDPEQKSATVTLFKEDNGGETVTVGVTAYLGVTRREPHSVVGITVLPAGKGFLEIHPVSEEVLLACSVGCLAGIEGIRRCYNEPFDYKITKLEGRNLTKSSSVGVSIAALRAIALAIGTPVPLDDEYDSYGWQPISP
jgi:hypothetical protein